MQISFWFSSTTELEAKTVGIFLEVCLAVVFAGCHILSQRNVSIFLLIIEKRLCFVSSLTQKPRNEKVKIIRWTCETLKGNSEGFVRARFEVQRKDRSNKIIQYIQALRSARYAICCMGPYCNFSSFRSLVTFKENGMLTSRNVS